MAEEAKKQKGIEKDRSGEKNKADNKQVSVEEVKREETSSKKAEKKEEKEAKKIQLTKKAEDIIKAVESMSVIELSNLVKALEEKFDISAQAPVVATAATQVASEAVKPEEEEKTTFGIILKEVGPKKIQVIKEIRAITTLGLKEAKDLVEQAPKPVKQEVDKQEAEEIKKKLEQAGAKVELK